MQAHSSHSPLAYGTSIEPIALLHPTPVLTSTPLALTERPGSSSLPIGQEFNGKWLNSNVPAFKPALPADDIVQVRILTCAASQNP
eukprot:5646995-Pleurochrysis_carterae.AAC.1